MEIENNKECFVGLWRRLKPTRRLLRAEYKRFCVRNVLKLWFGARANDDFIFEVCSRADVEGYEELPSPVLYPRKHRELLRAVVSVVTGIGMRQVNLKALDAAYSVVFPKSTAINVNKKGGAK